MPAAAQPRAIRLFDKNLKQLAGAADFLHEVLGTPATSMNTTG